MDNFDKRDELVTTLKFAYTRINALNAATRKINAIMAILLMKRDKARTDVKVIIQKLEAKISNIKAKIEEEINSAVDVKVKCLETKVQNMCEEICALGEICMTSEDTLKLHNEEKLEEEGPLLSSQMKEVMDEGLHMEEQMADLEDLMFLQFVPADLGSYVDWTNLGHVYSSSMDSGIFGTTPHKSGADSIQIDNVIGSLLSSGGSTNRISEHAGHDQHLLNSSLLTPHSFSRIDTRNVVAVNCQETPCSTNVSSRVADERTESNVYQLKEVSSAMSIRLQKDMYERLQNGQCSQSDLEGCTDERWQMRDSSLSKDDEYYSEVTSTPARPTHVRHLFKGDKAQASKSERLIESVGGQVSRTGNAVSDDALYQIKHAYSTPQEVPHHRGPNVCTGLKDVAKNLQQSSIQPEPTGDQVTPALEQTLKATKTIVSKPELKHPRAKEYMQYKVTTNVKSVTEHDQDLSKPVRTRESTKPAREHVKDLSKPAREHVKDLSKPTRDLSNSVPEHPQETAVLAPERTTKSETGLNTVQSELTMRNVSRLKDEQKAVSAWAASAFSGFLPETVGEKGFGLYSWGDTTEPPKTSGDSEEVRSPDDVRNVSLSKKTAENTSHSNATPPKKHVTRPTNIISGRMKTLLKSYIETTKTEEYRAKLMKGKKFKESEEKFATSESTTVLHGEKVGGDQPAASNVCSKGQDRVTEPTIVPDEEANTEFDENADIVVDKVKDKSEHRTPSKWTPRKTAASTNLYDESKASTNMYNESKASANLYDESKASANLYDESKASANLYDVSKTGEVCTEEPVKSTLDKNANSTSQSDAGSRKRVPRLFTDIGQIIYSSDRNDIPAKKVKSVGSLEKSPGDGFFLPIGVGYTSTGGIVVADSRNHLVKVVRNGVFELVMGHVPDQQNMCRKNFRDTGTPLVRPSAIAVNDRDQIFVKDDHEIIKFDSDGQVLLRFGKKMLKRPYGLSITYTGHVVTLDATHPHILYLFQQDGQLGYKNIFGPMGNMAGSKCRFLEVFGDKIIVSDLGLSVMYIGNVFTGQVYQCFGAYGKGPGMLREPSGVTVDSSGNWIIADSRNDRIQVFSANGEYMFPVKLSEHVSRPSGIMLTQDRHLLVVSYLTHSVKVFQI